jgi:uncharacterized protein with HEPN domain
MLDAARAIRRYLDGKTDDDLLNDPIPSDAVLRRFIMLGEAAARISEETEAGHPEIAWTKARGFRNVAVHSYFALDWMLVWTTAAEDIPTVVVALAAVVDEP